MKKLQKKALAILLLTVLCITAALPAMADERTADTYYYGGTGQDTIYDVTPLPNGNLLLNGYTQLGRNGQAQLSGSPRQTRAWLVCVAPDGSIAWEAVYDAQGTTRYVTPVLTSDGRIAVLYYNSPSQVTTEIAIHIYSLDGQLLEETALPLEVGLVEGRMTDGFVFYDWEKGYMAADLTGSVRTLDIQKVDRINPSGTASMVPYGDGWIIAGRTHNEDAGEAIAHYNKDGEIVWYYTTPELAEGLLVGPQILADGTLLFNWYKPDYKTGATLESRMICLDAAGTPLWELDIPSKTCGGFTATKDGYVFYDSWMEKTYTHIQFTLVGTDGQVKQQWQAEKRKELLFGTEVFLWNGEAWFHADTEREANRVNDRQEDLELQDCMLIRVSDCQAVENQQ